MQRSSHRIKQDHKRSKIHSNKLQARRTARKQQSQSVASWIAQHRQASARVNLQGLHDK